MQMAGGHTFRRIDRPSQLDVRRVWERARKCQWSTEDPRAFSQKLVRPAPAREFVCTLRYMNIFADQRYVGNLQLLMLQSNIALNKLELHSSTRQRSIPLNSFISILHTVSGSSLRTVEFSLRCEMRSEKADVLPGTPAEWKRLADVFDSRPFALLIGVEFHISVISAQDIAYKSNDARRELALRLPNLFVRGIVAVKAMRAKYT